MPGGARRRIPDERFDEVFAQLGFTPGPGTGRVGSRLEPRASELLGATVATVAATVADADADPQLITGDA